VSIVVEIGAIEWGYVPVATGIEAGRRELAAQLGASDSPRALRLTRVTRGHRRMSDAERRALAKCSASPRSARRLSFAPARSPVSYLLASDPVLLCVAGLCQAEWGLTRR
jgi:hypothetical protein